MHILLAEATQKHECMHRKRNILKAAAKKTEMQAIRNWDEMIAKVKEQLEKVTRDSIKYRSKIDDLCSQCTVLRNKMDELIESQNLTYWERYSISVTKTLPGWNRALPDLVMREKDFNFVTMKRESHLHWCNMSSKRLV